MRLIILLAGLLPFCAAPAGAQIVSTHPPLSPAEAVRVLRASHSPYDVTNLPFYGGDQLGPLILIGGGASVRDWPREAYEPIRPLSAPWSSTTYLGRGFRDSRSAAPVVTLSPWTMRAVVGPDRSAADRSIRPSTSHPDRRR